MWVYYPRKYFHIMLHCGGKPLFEARSRINELNARINELNELKWINFFQNRWFFSNPHCRPVSIAFHVCAPHCPTRFQRLALARHDDNRIYWGVCGTNGRPQDVILRHVARFGHEVEFLVLKPNMAPPQSQTRVFESLCTPDIDGCGRRVIQPMSDVSIVSAAST